jgi:hypothetical protein
MTPSLARTGSALKLYVCHNFSKEMEKILIGAKERQMTGKEFVWIVFLAIDSPNPTHHVFHDGMFGTSFTIQYRYICL